MSAFTQTNATSSSDLSTDDGAEILYDKADAVVDIVFVHGLSGHRMRTWETNATIGNPAVLWPRDLLGPSLGNARILTWGYDACVNAKNPAHSINKETIGGHVESLLNDLAEIRDTGWNRSLIFVGHNLGGIIIREALRRAQTIEANKQDRNKGAVFTSTLGVLFMATPHRGINDNVGMNSIEGIWARIVRLTLPANFNIVDDHHLVESIRSGSSFLATQMLDFSSLSRRFMRICCFYERQDANTIVPTASAVIDGHNVQSIAINASHAAMCKFGAASNRDYRQVLYQIRQILQPPEDPPLTA